MSYHGICYHVYPDDTTNHTDDQWRKASDFCIEYRKDWNEAVALARMASINCNFPFIVQERHIGGEREELTYFWRVKGTRL